MNEKEWNRFWNFLLQESKSRFIGEGRHHTSLQSWLEFQMKYFKQFKDENNPFIP